MFLLKVQYICAFLQLQFVISFSNVMKGTKVQKLSTFYCEYNGNNNYAKYKISIVNIALLFKEAMA